MSWWPVLAAAAAVLVLLACRYGAGFLQIRSGLRAVAGGKLRLPLMPRLPRGLRGAGRDLREIADRLGRLEREASSEHSEFSAVLDSIDEGVFIVDRDLRILLANLGVTRIFALSAPPAGRRVLEAFRLHELHRLVEEGIRSGRPCRAELSPGEGRTLEVATSPLVSEDGGNGAVVVVRDISEVRRLERVRREFVANVSHELRTPLTIIGGYLETLREGGSEDRAMLDNALGVMSKHSDRLKRLVDDLLVISQAESPELLLQLQRVDLPALIGRVVAQCHGLVEERGARVRIDAAAGDLSVEADPARLEHVFLNLLDNALQHGGRSGLEVVFHIARSGREIIVGVTDNGIGIPYADQEHVFERFYRVHKDRSRGTGGTGLGLSIVKRVTEAHGGSVSVESTPGAGATFRVVLPAAAPRAEKS